MPEMASPLGTLIEVASLTPSGYEPMLTVVVWPSGVAFDGTFNFKSSAGPTIGLSKEKRKTESSSEATIAFCCPRPMS